MYLCKRNKKSIKFTTKMEWIKLTKDNKHVIDSLPPSRVAIAWKDGFGRMHACMYIDCASITRTLKETSEYYLLILPELNF